MLKRTTGWVLYHDNNGGDCTNNGISSKHQILIVISGTEIEIEEYRQKYAENERILNKTVVLVKRQLFGKPLWYFEPLVKPKGKIGGMSGGNYCNVDYNANDDFTPYGLGFPLPIHDRFETQEEYDALSRQEED